MRRTRSAQTNLAWIFRKSVTAKAFELLGASLSDGAFVSRRERRSRPPQRPPAVAGLSTLATAPLRLLVRDHTGTIAILAPYLFVVVNLIIGIIALASLWLVFRNSVSCGRLTQRHRGAAAATPTEAARPIVHVMVPA
jgi:hypothetical protein